MIAHKNAHTTLFLTEYYLITRDEKVMPAIKACAKGLAEGRSGVGTWGHSMTRVWENDGKLYGPAPGYGAMNQIGLTCTIALILAIIPRAGLLTSAPLVRQTDSFRREQLLQRGARRANRVAATCIYRPLTGAPFLHAASADD